MKGFSSSIAAATMARSVYGLATFNPNPDTSISVGVPATASTSTSGDLYVQMVAPQNYAWAALGTGTLMSGSHMFVMYANGDGNVTVSARQGTGHSPPSLASEVAITLLEGSGIVGGQMMANILCRSCASLLASTSDPSSPWLSAWKIGPPINNANASAPISRHDDTSQFTLDLGQAKLSSSSNPFVAAGQPDASANATSSSSSSSSPQSLKSPGSPASLKPYQTLPTYQKAHGIMMGVAVIILFPLGALFMPLLGRHFTNPAVPHGIFQCLGLAVFITAFILGVHLAQMGHQLFNNVHTQLGLALLAMFAIQPVVGIVHHVRFRWDMTSQRRILATFHRWFGRSAIALSVVNGGLGLQLAGNTKGGEYAWAFSAGAVAIVWVSVVLVGWFVNQGKGDRREQAGYEMSEEEDMKNRNMWR